MFSNRKSQLVIRPSTFLLERRCGPYGCIKSDICQFSMCRTGLNISSSFGFCFCLGSAAAGAAVILFSGASIISGSMVSPILTGLPPSHQVDGSLKHVSSPGFCGNLQTGSVSYRTYDRFFLSPLSPISAFVCSPPSPTSLSPSAEPPANSSIFSASSSAEISDCWKGPRLMR